MEQFIAGIGIWLTGLTSAFVNTLTALAKMFVEFDATTQAIIGPSVLGWLGLGTVALALLGSAFSFVKKLIKLR